jgi:hypothetical protein
MRTRWLVIHTAILVWAALFTLTSHICRDTKAFLLVDAERAQLVQGESDRRDQRPLVLTSERSIPVSTREDFYPDPPLLTEQLPHFEEYEIQPCCTCTLQLVHCVYVRYWPRDPPTA